MFRMKCYDGKTILVNKCNNYASGLLTNYDTLISDLDSKLPSAEQQIENFLETWNSQK